MKYNIVELLLTKKVKFQLSTYLGSLNNDFIDEFRGFMTKIDEGRIFLIH